MNKDGSEQRTSSVEREPCAANKDTTATAAPATPVMGGGDGSFKLEMMFSGEKTVARPIMMAGERAAQSLGKTIQLVAIDLPTMTIHMLKPLLLCQRVRQSKTKPLTCGLQVTAAVQAMRFNGFIIIELFNLLD